MKTVLFTPGFHSEEVYENYKGKPALELIKSLGYNLEFVPIKWQRTTVDDWTKRLREVYAKHKPANTILAGFSLGAITSLVVAAERQPNELWLFSLSPFFAEDLKFQKRAYMERVIGKRREAAFSRLHFDKLASRITCPTLIMAGTEEMKRYPGIKRRSEATRGAIKGSRYVVIDGAEHAIASPPYLKAIKQNI